MARILEVKNAQNQRLTNSIKTVLPIIYFIGITIYWAYDNFYQGQHFNYVTLGIAAILITQIFFNNKFLGISLGILGLIVSILIFLAVLSEFNEFKIISQEAKQLLTIGSLLSLGGVVMAAIMITTNLKMFMK